MRSAGNLDVVPADLQFEFGSESANGRNGTPPIGVPAFALGGGKSRRYRHRPRSYSALGNSAAGSWRGWHMVCGSGRRGDIFGRYGGDGGWFGVSESFQCER